MTSLDDYSDDEIIEELSTEPLALMQNSVISSSFNKPVTTNLLQERQSSLGQLDILPIEIQHSILLDLDLQSLCHLRLTSYRDRIIVDTCVPLVNLVTHASNTLRTLSQTRTLSYHTLRTLHQALTSRKCEFCHDFGPFLFMLTCQRACSNCLLRSPLTRLIPQNYLKDDVNSSSLKELPTLSIMPAWYVNGQRSRDDPSREEVEELVLASSAIEVTLTWEAYYAIEGMRETYGDEPIAEDWNYDQANSEVERTRRSQRSPLVRNIPPPLFPSYVFYASNASTDPDLEPEDQQYLFKFVDRYRCAGGTPFPVLDPRTGNVDEGYWCLGCHNAFQIWRREELDGGSFGFDSSWETYLRMEQGELRAWDSKGFVDHVRECENVRAELEGKHVLTWT